MQKAFSPATMSSTTTPPCVQHVPARRMLFKQIQSNAVVGSENMGVKPGSSQMYFLHNWQCWTLHSWAPVIITQSLNSCAPFCQFFSQFVNKPVWQTMQRCASFRISSFLATFCWKASAFASYQEEYHLPKENFPHWRCHSILSTLQHPCSGETRFENVDMTFFDMVGTHKSALLKKAQQKGCLSELPERRCVFSITKHLPDHKNGKHMRHTRWRPVGTQWDMQTCVFVIFFQIGELTFW